MSQVLFGLFGLSVLLGIAFLFSNNKKSVDWRLVATGVVLQVAFAAFVLLVPNIPISETRYIPGTVVEGKVVSIKDYGAFVELEEGIEGLVHISELANMRVDRVEDIAARIREETQATPARAQLLARDQVLKLNNSVTQARHQAAGVTEYIWRTSRDERVRSRHKELEGTQQAYASPPIVDRRTGRRAHPGGDYQCRCTAEPIIPRFE